MSLTDVHIQLGVDSPDPIIVKPDISVVVDNNNRNISIIAAGNLGPRGPAGKWRALTQNEYDLLNPPDPNVLYIIIQ